MNLTFLQRNLLLDVFSNLESIICEAQLIQELKNIKLNDFCTFNVFFRNWNICKSIVNIN